MPRTLDAIEQERLASLPATHSLRWSYGRNRYDACPRQQEGDIRAFVAAVKKHRAKDKASSGYICAPMTGDGRRSLGNAGPRAWLALDVDEMHPDALPDWRMFLAGSIRGFGWPTALSTPEAPRERVIVTLDRPVDRREGIYIGEHIARTVARVFGSRVRLDPCTFRGEQPCFLPLKDAPLFFLTHDAPLEAGGITGAMPPPPPPMPEPTPAEREMLDGRFGWLLDALLAAGMLRERLSNGLGFSMFCPWMRSHTTDAGRDDTSTALLFPAAANGWRGGFVCLHSHCHGTRRLSDLLRLMVKAENTVSASRT